MRWTVSPLDISENECRDVALQRLYKDFRQRRINFWRCLLLKPGACAAWIIGHSLLGGAAKQAI
ncbi:hypothetical protein [Nostoc sp. TCL26-01]|uniref:hypothetical protein n=1 Tax=Nostoc sp. TCL26-01 TaxID=2576904 RepID=UPI0015BF8006|nr:hypothetical protein [Nostoc sp. TCL26-01]